MPNGPLLALEFLIMGFFEVKRFQGWKETGTSGFVNVRGEGGPATEPRRPLCCLPK